MKTKIRRFIKRHLLSVLLYGFFAVILFGAFVMLAEYAFADRGYLAIGGEYFFVPLLLTIWLGYKYVFKG